MKIKSKHLIFSLSILRILIGALFLYSGLSKLIRPIEYFEAVIIQYQIFPESLVAYGALIVPWVELIFGCFLMLGLDVLVSGWILIGLAAAFQIILGQAILRKLPFEECGCFGGTFIQLSLFQSFLLDSALVVILILITTSQKTLFSWECWGKKNPLR